MQIRKIDKADLNIVSSICMKAFMHSVAPTLSGEGVDTFGKIASVDSFLNRMKEDNVILIYEEIGEIKGVVELKEGRHLAMLFVDLEFQKKGIGKNLVSAVLSYAKVEKITVSASLNSVPAYLSYGFINVGQPDEKSGLKYQPMELELNKAFYRASP